MLKICYLYTFSFLSIFVKLFFYQSGFKNKAHDFICSYSLIILLHMNKSHKNSVRVCVCWLRFKPFNCFYWSHWSVFLCLWLQSLENKNSKELKTAPSSSESDKGVKNVSKFFLYRCFSPVITGIRALYLFVGARRCGGCVTLRRPDAE